MSRFDTGQHVRKAFSGITHKLSSKNHGFPDTNLSVRTHMNCPHHTTSPAQSAPHQITGPVPTTPDLRSGLHHTMDHLSCPVCATRDRRSPFHIPLPWEHHRQEPARAPAHLVVVQHGDQVEDADDDGQVGYVAGQRSKRLGHGVQYDQNNLRSGCRGASGHC